MKEETATQETKEDQKSFGKMFKADFTKAAWRTGATQLTNAAQAGILAMLKDRGADENKLALARELLDTPMGAVLIRAVLGYSLTYMPMVKDDPRGQRLAEELRVSAMDRGSEEVLGAVFEYLMPAVQTAVAALPPIETAIPEVLKPKRKRVSAPKARVSPPVEVKEEIATETTEETVTGEKKAAELPTPGVV